MISVNKQKFKKFLKGVGVAIIIYIAFSILATKFVYDFVFRQYSAPVAEFFTGELPEGASDTAYSFQCGDNTLKGWLYSDGDSEKGLIVLAPGFRSQHDEYESVIYAFVQEGFDVFTFDPTGHGASGGKNSIGFPQIINDIDASMGFINSRDNFGHDDVFLLGFSRGAYGVCCTVNNYPGVTAAVSVNGVDTSMDAIMALSSNYVGGIAYMGYPFLDAYEDIVFGRELAEMSAVAELNESEIPVLVIQSENDEQISNGKHSIYAKKEKITSANTEFLLYSKDGCDGHTTILYNETYQPNNDIVKIISAFYIQKTGNEGITR